MLLLLKRIFDEFGLSIVNEKQQSCLGVCHSSHQEFSSNLLTYNTAFPQFHHFFRCPKNSPKTNIYLRYTIQKKLQIKSLLLNEKILNELYLEKAKEQTIDSHFINSEKYISNEIGSQGYNDDRHKIVIHLRQIVINSADFS